MFTNKWFGWKRIGIPLGYSDLPRLLKFIRSYVLNNFYIGSLNIDKWDMFFFCFLNFLEYDHWVNIEHNNHGNNKKLDNKASSH